MTAVLDVLTFGVMSLISTLSQPELVNTSGAVFGTYQVIVHSNGHLMSIIFNSVLISWLYTQAVLLLCSVVPQQYHFLLPLGVYWSVLVSSIDIINRSRSSPPIQQFTVVYECSECGSRREVEENECEDVDSELEEEDELEEEEDYESQEECECDERPQE